MNADKRGSEQNNYVHGSLEGPFVLWSLSVVTIHAYCLIVLIRVYPRSSAANSCRWRSVPNRRAPVSKLSRLLKSAHLQKVLLFHQYASTKHHQLASAGAKRSQAKL